LRRTGRSSLVRAISLGAALSLIGPGWVRSVSAAPTAFQDPEAEALYNEGLQKSDAGDFEGALEPLDASLSIERTAKALYAKAHSLHRLDRCRDAVPLYRETLTMVQEGSPADLIIRDALVNCAEKMAEEDDPIVAPVITEPVADDDVPVDEPDDTDDVQPDEPRKPWYTDVYAPIFIGVGAVGVGVGGYFLSEAAKENARQPEQYDEFAAKGDRVTQLQVRGGVILGIGGALVLTGAIRYAVLAARGRKSKTAFVPSPSLGRRWAGVSFSGRF